MTTIYRNDPRHLAAKKVLEAMHEFWKLAPCGGAVQWIEDTDGHLVVFTRGEYKDSIAKAIGENPQPVRYFELDDAYDLDLVNNQFAREAEDEHSNYGTY